MTKGEEHIAAARTIAQALGETLAGQDAPLALRYRTLVTAFDQMAGHFFVKSALSVTFTAAVRRAAEAAREGHAATGVAGALDAIAPFEAAVVKLQGKTTGSGGVVIT
ncbi:MAG: hypothetical protein FJ029_07870 [Actinobacteria bacterium]|nr:hypothetical protein [Actinomycetota bacterium]